MPLTDKEKVFRISELDRRRVIARIEQVLEFYLSQVAPGHEWRLTIRSILTKY